MTTSLVIRRAEVEGAIVDVRCDAGRITAVGAGLEGADIEHDAAGGAVLPGLHDHHLHLLALAAARSSVDVETLTDPAGFDAAVRAAAAIARPGDWVRVVGFHESTMGPLDRWRLDALAPGVPVRVQHASGALWIWNGPALVSAGIDRWVDEGAERDDGGRLTGRLFGLDHRRSDAIPPEPLDVAAIGRELASYGITGVTDLTPTVDTTTMALLAHHVVVSGFPLDVTVTGGLDLDPDAAPELPRGPVKLLAADHRLPLPADLARSITAAHGRGRNVAVHCASRIGLVVTLAAFEDAGVEPGDRIEHGAVIPIQLVGAVRELGLTIVTQPAFVASRGDRYLREHPANEHADLWRCGSLLRAGAGVAAGSDAPFGDPDPWVGIEAAIFRRTNGGRILGEDERIPAREAMALWLTPADDPAGPVRRVAPGQPARLCVLRCPLGDVLRSPSADVVRAIVGRTGWLDRR
jgi:predicted amidohydrolase YtcJ